MDGADKVGADGLLQYEEIADVAPLVLVAASALLVGVASLAWAVGRAWRSLGNFNIVLEDGYERRDGYWVE